MENDSYIKTIEAKLAKLKTSLHETKTKFIKAVRRANDTEDAMKDQQQEFGVKFMRMCLQKIIRAK